MAQFSRRAQTRLCARSMLVRCMCRSGCVPKEGAMISNRPSGLSCATQWPAAQPDGQRTRPVNRVWQMLNSAAPTRHACQGPENYLAQVG